MNQIFLFRHSGANLWEAWWVTGEWRQSSQSSRSVGSRQHARTWPVLYRGSWYFREAPKGERSGTHHGFLLIHNAVPIIKSIGHKLHSTSSWTEVWWVSQLGEALASCTPSVMCTGPTEVCCVCLLSHILLFATPWTVARQAPLSMGILQARILEWVAMPSSRESSWSRDWTQVSCIVGRFFTVWATKWAPNNNNVQWMNC